MRKKWSYLLLLLVIMLFSACSSNNDGANQEQTITSNEEHSQINSPTSQPEEDSNEEQTEELEVPEQDPVTLSEPQYKINPANSNVVPLADAPENVVMLTFDDAPDKHALEIANILHELNVNAIFFVNGHFLDTDAEKEVLKEIHDMGFLIGNHTMSHQLLRDLSEEEQYKEIVELNNLVESIIGERPKFLRAPFGVNTDYSRKVAADEKMVVMNWTYGYDFEKEYMNKDAIADIMVNTEYLRNGANLLMHDRQWTKEALRDIVTGLQEKGYEIVDPHLIETL
ncbi:polysaccharide deacetylase family protein [Calidifontibacillus oryziterrae]|uniref:polysaccharide deacetylase family protein n=1 Tax=Calidifontibacillus oryziterrae TaxID=1191699 RepID=UPI0002FF6D9E|nr:polysaccharide deacetylase family protein [Calidifontibacillus oryziterrae]